MGDEYGYLGGSERQSDMTQMGEGRGKTAQLTVCGWLWFVRAVQGQPLAGLLGCCL
jgi:hypothetical protein